MFGFGKGRVRLEVLENSTMEQKLMDIFSQLDIKGVECELGALFGRMNEKGFVNSYFVSNKDWRRIKKAIR